VNGTATGEHGRRCGLRAAAVLPGDASTEPLAWRDGGRWQLYARPAFVQHTGVCRTCRTRALVLTCADWRLPVPLGRLRAAADVLSAAGRRLLHPDGGWVGATADKDLANETVDGIAPRVLPLTLCIWRGTMPAYLRLTLSICCTTCPAGWERAAARAKLPAERAGDVAAAANGRGSASALAIPAAVPGIFLFL